MALLFLVAVALPFDAAAQFLNEVGTERTLPPFEIPIRLNSSILDSKNFMPRDSTVVLAGHKNPFVAAALSLALPGLGEYYVGDQIWRGVIFTVLETGLWLERVNYIARGKDSTIAFRAWGDSLWSPARYASYLNTLLANHGIQPISNPDDFTQINRAEDTLNTLHESNLTHRLPIEDRQQYYELISKYIQFTAGWKDANDQDPTHSAMYEHHANMRAAMNYQYAVADYFLYGVLLNHILSAVDAVLLTHDHNSALRIGGDLKQESMPDGTVRFVPNARIDFRF